jgi:hypothetical protein
MARAAARLIWNGTERRTQMRVEELAVPKGLFEPAAPSDNPTSTPP